MRRGVASLRDMDELAAVPPPPPAIAELRLACERFVGTATKVVIDGTADTLPVLDHYLRDVPHGRDELDAIVAAAAGAYFGEVVRAAWPCHWNIRGEDPASWRIEFDQVFLHFQPVVFALEAIHRDDVVEGGAGFGVLDEDLAALRAALEGQGEVAPDDYFRLSVRFDVLASIIDRLIPRAVNEDGSVARYTAEAYSVALDGDVPRANS